MVRQEDAVKLELLQPPRALHINTVLIRTLCDIQTTLLQWPNILTLYNIDT